MIVISESLVLAATGAVTADNPVVGWRNLVTTSNLAADFEDTDYPAVNLANPSTAQKWLGQVDASPQYLTVTLSGSDEIDYLAVARHNFGTAQIAVKPQGDDGGGYADLTSEVLPGDDAPLLFRFDPQSLQAIRLRMAVGTAAPSAAVLYVGKLLVLQRRIYVGHVPIPYGRRTQVTNGRSESGNFLGRIVTGETRETAVSIRNMTPAWYRTEMDPFIAAAQETPFFFAWRPGAYPDEIGYAHVTNEPQPSNQRSNGMMQIDLQLGGTV